MTRSTTTRRADPSRVAAEREALEELEAWRAQAIPDPSAPLDADDLVRLLHDCVAMLELDDEVAAEVSVHTVHYYRRKEIIDPPRGTTRASRYEIRHLWQMAGARLAGHLGLVTLAEARDAIRDADNGALMAFLAARVADARARRAMLRPRAEKARPLPPVSSARSDTTSPAVMIALPGGAMCVLPESHPAHRSRDAARELVRALGAALRVPNAH